MRGLLFRHHTTGGGNLEQATMPTEHTFSNGLTFGFFALTCFNQEAESFFQGVRIERMAD